MQFFYFPDSIRSRHSHISFKCSLKWKFLYLLFSEVEFWVRGSQGGPRAVPQCPWKCSCLQALFLISPPAETQTRRNRTCWKYQIFHFVLFLGDYVDYLALVIRCVISVKVLGDGECVSFPSQGQFYRIYGYTDEPSNIVENHKVKMIRFLVLFYFNLG